MTEKKTNISKEEKSIYQARSSEDFLSLARELSWTKIGLLETKAHKLLNFYADRDMYDEITEMVKVIEVLEFWWTIKVNEDEHAPLDIRADALDYIARKKKRDKFLGSKPPQPEDTRAMIVKYGRVYIPKLNSMTR